MIKARTCESGKIEKVFYNSPTFSTGLLRNENDKLKRFAGKLYAEEDRDITIYGNYETGDYGRQFIVDYVENKEEMDLQGLIKYLSICPEAKRIGPSKAKKIVDKFGINFEKILFKTPEKITNFANLPKNSLNNLKKKWESSIGWNQVYPYLASFDLTYLQISNLVNNLKSECIYLLKTDPYKLISISKGLNFVKIDEIAMKLNFDKKFPSRLKEGVKYSLNTYMSKGHCWVEFDELNYLASKFLALDDMNYKKIIDNIIKNLISEEILINLEIKDKNTVGFRKIADREKYLSEIFINKENLYNNDILKNKKSIEVLERHNLNNMQIKAVKTAFSQKISVISGGAGTGKTYVLKIISDICKSNNLEVCLAAPTGKAARRIEEVAKTKASTIHRLLGYNRNKFLHEKDEFFELDCNILILDEISMIDVNLFWHLFKSINLNTTRVVLVGDHNQLPPVGPGNILRDLMVLNPVKTTVLTEIVRQAGALKKNSSAILEGILVEPTESVQNEWMVEDKYKDPILLKNKLLKIINFYISEIGNKILEDLQILSPTHKGPIGTKQLNIEIRKLIQEELFKTKIDEETPKFLKNDKIIQTYNDYNTGIMNGEIGYVIEAKQSGDIIVKFNNIDRPIHIKKSSVEMNNLQLAYCLTVHKVQGSQFPYVISIIHKSHNYLHHRNLLYTAVTRSEKTSIILGDKWGIQNCINKVETEKRRTFLSHYLSPSTNLKSNRRYV